MKPILITLLFCLSFFLRLYNLEIAPPALLDKEVRIGFAAFTLLKDTSTLPQIFSNTIGTISISDIGPLAIITILPSIAVTGLTPLGVRLPSALIGSGTIILFYFLAKELVLLFHNRITSLYAVIAACLFAISPWHIQLSRIDTGINLGLFLLLLSFFLLLKFRHYPERIFILLLPGVLGVYAEYLFIIPFVLLVVTILIYHRAAIKKHLVVITVSVLLSLLLLAPLTKNITTSFTYQDDTKIYWLLFNEKRAQDRISYSNNTKLANIVHTKTIEDSKLHAQHLTAYFEPQQLFTKWTHTPAYVLPFSGLFYPVDVVSLMLGLLILLRSHRRIFMLYGVGVSIFVSHAALTRSTPDPLRIYALLPATILILAYGYYYAFMHFHHRWKRTYAITLGAFILFFVFRFSDLYFFHYEKLVHDYPQQYLHAFAYTKSLQTPIVITDVTYGKNIFLYWSFANKTLELPATYTRVFQTPVTYIPGTIYIQPSETVPSKANVLFKSPTNDKKTQISIFTIR